MFQGALVACNGPVLSEEKIHSDWSDLYLQTIFCCNNYFNHLVDCQNKPNYQYQLNLVFVHRVAKVHFILLVTNKLMCVHHV